MIYKKLFNKNLVVIHIFFIEKYNLFCNIFYIKNTYIYYENVFLTQLLFIREALDLTIEEPADTFSEEISRNAVLVLAVSKSDATASTSATSTASHVKK